MQANVDKDKTRAQCHFQVLTDLKIMIGGWYGKKWIKDCVYEDRNVFLDTKE